MVRHSTTLGLILWLLLLPSVFGATVSHKDFDTSNFDATPGIGVKLKKDVVVGTLTATNSDDSGVSMEVPLLISTKNQVNGPLNVRAFGAKGDYNPDTGEGTDDYPAFTNALANAGISGYGGVIHVPVGRYKLSKSVVVPSSTKIIGDGTGNGYNAWPGGTYIYWTAPNAYGFILTNRSSTLQSLWMHGMGIVSNVVEEMNENHQVISCNILGAYGAAVHLGAYANHNLIYDTDISHNYNGVVADGFSSTQSSIAYSRLQYNTNCGIYASSYIGFIVGPGTKIEENRGPGILLAVKDGLYMDEFHFFDGWNEVSWGGNLVTTNLSSNPNANVGTITIGPNVRWTEGGTTNYPGITNGYSKISSTYQFLADREVFGGPIWIDTNVTALTFLNCPYIGDIWGNTNSVRFLSFDNPGTDRLINGGLRGAEKFSVSTNGLIRVGDGLWISSSNPTNQLGTTNKFSVNTHFGVDASGNSFQDGTAFVNHGYSTNEITAGTTLNSTSGGIIGAASIQTKRLGVNASPQGNLDVYGNDWAYLRPYTTNTDATTSPDPGVNGHAFGWNRSQGRGESVHAFSKDVGTDPALEIGMSSSSGYQGLWEFKADLSFRNTNSTFVVDANALVTAKTAYLTGIAGSNTVESVGAIMVRPGTIISSSGSAVSLQHSGSEALIQTWNSSPFGIETVGVRRMTVNNSGIVNFPFGEAFGITSPAQITSNQNNYNPGGITKYLRLNTDASRNITGLTFSTAQITGQEHVIVNVGAQNIVLVNESASSTAANRFTNTTGADITLSANQQARLWYDGTSSRWRVTKDN